MVPAPDTINAIYSIIEKMLNENHQPKNWKADWWAALWSTPTIFEVLIPSGLLILAVISGVIYKFIVTYGWLRWLGLTALLLIYVSLSIGICMDASRALKLLLIPRNFFNSILGKIRKLTHTGAPHVTELYKFTRQDLEYVLVELKAERAALERRIGLQVGALEKIGFVPGIVALAAAFARVPGIPSSPWIQGIAYGLPTLYIIGIYTHLRMTEFDRVFMIMEQVIDTKKSEEDDSNESRELMC